MINLELTYKENKFSYKGIDFDVNIKSTKNKIIMSIIKSEEYIKNNFNTSLEDILIELEFSIPMDYFGIEAINAIHYQTKNYLHKFNKLSKYNKFKKQYDVNICIYNSDNNYFRDFLLVNFESEGIISLYSHMLNGNRLFCNRVKILDITENKYIEEKLEYISENNLI